MNKTEFRIDEVMHASGIHCYIFRKSFNIFGFPKWKLYDTDMNNGQFLTVEQAENWLKEHVEKKNFEPYIINQSFISI